MPRFISTLRFIAALLVGGAGGWLWRDGGAILHPASPISVNPTVPAVPTMPPAPAVLEIIPPPLQPLIERVPEAAAAAPIMTVDLMIALDEGSVTAEFRGNGVDSLRMVVVNRAKQPIRLSFPSGQTFEGTGGKVVIARPCTFDMGVAESRLEELETLALASTAPLGDQGYVPVASVKGKLEPLLDYLEAHPELPLPAAQTAALAILENLPAAAFGKFGEASHDAAAEWSPAFKVETVDLIKALITLREIGLESEELSITLDPQTKIEAMIDPLAHAFAMQYYEIHPDQEWAYWKDELLTGNAATRHYALHGIALYYPDVAVEMLPQWVREARTNRVYRLAALEALVATKREDALKLLREMQQEFGPDAELGKKASESVRQLEALLGQEKAAPKVGFRISQLVDEE